jgi:hypothetical protein
MIQLSEEVRNALLDQVETTVGTEPILEIRTGPPPANTAAVATGTILASMTLPTNWMANAASGQKQLAGVWQDTSADTTGTAGHFRIRQGSLCHAHGAVGVDLPLTTTVTAPINTNVLTFTSTTGVAVGALVTGTGIAPGTFVLSFTSTTVNLSDAVTLAVTSGTSITFSGDMSINTLSIVAGQQVSVNVFTLVAPNA